MSDRSYGAMDDEDLNFDVHNVKKFVTHLLGKGGGWLGTPIKCICMNLMPVNAQVPRLDISYDFIVTSVNYCTVINRVKRYKCIIPFHIYIRKGQLHSSLYLTFCIKSTHDSKVVLH